MAHKIVTAGCYLRLCGFYPRQNLPDDLVLRIEF